MSVGHSPDIPQFEPDMPKNAENITAEDMEEAKRRIEGSQSAAAEHAPIGATVH